MALNFITEGVCKKSEMLKVEMEYAKAKFQVRDPALHINREDGV